MRCDNQKIKLFKWSGYIGSILIEIIEIIFQAFWLSMLDHNDLNNLTKIGYVIRSEMYQNDEYNTSGFWAWEEKTIERFFYNCKKVLVGAAGGGREVIALSNRGMHADAFECNENLVAYSKNLLRKRGIKAEIALSVPDQVPKEYGIYDGIIMGWGGYTHIHGSKNRIEFLRQCYDHIITDGPLLLSFWQNNRNTKNPLKIRIANFIRHLRRSKEMIESGDLLDIDGFFHAFKKEEIEKEMNEAGFHLILYFSEMDVSYAIGRAFNPE